MKKKIFLPFAGIICLLNNTATACSVNITVSPNDTVCSGTSLTFNASVIAVCTTFYMDWYLNGSIVLSVSSSTPVPYTLNSPVSGDEVYCVVACNPFDVCSSNHIVMNVISSVTTSVSITASPDTVCSPDCFTFTATPVNGGSSPTFQWYLDGSPAASATSTTWTACNLSPGNHLVYFSLTSSVACANPSPVLSGTDTVVVLLCTGMEEKDLNSSFFIYPNTSDGIFVIHFNFPPHDTYLSVTNLVGEIIYEQKILSEKTEINLSNHSSGIYFITLLDEKNNSVTRKLLKM